MTKPARAALNGAILLLAGFAILATPAIGPYVLITPASADDGDDGDDGGGGSGSGGEYGGGGLSGGGYGGGKPPRILRHLLRPFGGVFRSSRPRGTVIQIPTMADREIIAMGLSAENLVLLTGRGYEVIGQISLPTLNDSVVKLEPPAATSLETARAEVRAVGADARVDFNHYYQPSQDAETGSGCEGRGCWPRELVGWPADHVRTANGCRAPIRIGMIDTGINPDHEAFSGSTLEVKRIGDDGAPESGHQHGTAVAALLVGSAASGTPGLLREAELFAVDAFSRAGPGGDRAEAFHIVAAIDYLLGQRVSVVNMSLAGETNEVLRRAIDLALTRNGTPIVAAVGNEGPRAEPAFPAAFPGVIGVTAIDSRKRVYRRAGQGAHVDIAAPGVGIWTAASIKGSRPKTGTSFAAPYVAAATALLRAAEPHLKPQELKERLYAQAADLGEPGRDDVFGRGLLDASGICSASAAPASIRLE